MDNDPNYLFYHLTQMMVAFRLCIPQMSNRRLSYQYHDKYKYLYEQRLKQDVSNDGHDRRPDKEEGLSVL